MSTAHALSENTHPLLAESKRGDRKAMSTLLRDSQPVLIEKLAGRIPHDLQSLLSVEDVLQETFAEAFHDFKRFQGDDQPSLHAWLGKMAAHNLLDAIDALTAEKRGGRQTRGQTQSLDDSQLQLVDLLIAGDPTPRSGLERSEWKTRLHQVVEDLPTAYREVVDRHDLKGQSAAEVAEALSISLGAFWMRRSRALKLLRELLGTTSQFF